MLAMPLARSLIAVVATVIAVVPAVMMLAVAPPIAIVIPIPAMMPVIVAIMIVIIAMVVIAVVPAIVVTVIAASRSGCRQRRCKRGRRQQPGKDQLAYHENSPRVPRGRVLRYPLCTPAEHVVRPIFILPAT